MNFILKESLLNEAKIIIHHGNYVDPKTFVDADGNPYDLIALDPNELSKFMSSDTTDTEVDTGSKIKSEPDDDDFIDLDDYDSFDDDPTDDDFSFKPDELNDDESVKLPKKDTTIDLPDRPTKGGTKSDASKSQAANGKSNDASNAEPSEINDPSNSGQPESDNKDAEKNKKNKIIFNKRDNKEYIWDDKLKKYVRFI